VETFRSQDAVSAKEAATVVIPRRFEREVRLVGSGQG